MNRLNFDNLLLRAKVWRLSWGKREEYRSYIRAQIDRTYPKRRGPLMPRTELFVDLLTNKGLLNQYSKVLCIGCRNGHEVDYFHGKGVRNVVGIDLISDRPDILVMDMHKMDFQDDTFDLVYSSHSLEHAFDAATVANEMTRVAKDGAVVAIEVPVSYPTTAADRIDFGTAESLLTLFGPSLNDVIWQEWQPSFSERNENGTDIIRVVFSVTKPDHASTI